MKHPLAKGTLVKVRDRKRDFEIVKPIHQVDALVGYRCVSPQGRLEAIRVEEITQTVPRPKPRPPKRR